jgi:hypothetical protein
VAAGASACELPLKNTVAPGVLVRPNCDFIRQDTQHFKSFSIRNSNTIKYTIYLVSFFLLCSSVLSQNSIRIISACRNFFSGGHPSSLPADFAPRLPRERSQFLCFDIHTNASPFLQKRASLSPSASHTYECLFCFTVASRLESSNSKRLTKMPGARNSECYFKKSKSVGRPRTRPVAARTD